MSALTEEKKPDTLSGDNVVPDWAIGYTLSLPCDKKTPQCDKEAEWFASQHGCIKAHICDDHMRSCFIEVNRTIAEYGAVQCTQCKQDFTNFAAFIKGVRI